MDTKCKKRLIVAFISVLILGSLSAIYYFLVIEQDKYNIARDPFSIAKTAGWFMPEYVVISHEDNMDRQQSAWSSYEWTVMLSEPLSNEELKNLDELVTYDEDWEKLEEDGIVVYEYSSTSRDDDTDTYIQINTKSSVIKLNYSWWDIFS